MWCSDLCRMQSLFVSDVQVDALTPYLIFPPVNITNYVFLKFCKEKRWSCACSFLHNPVFFLYLQKFTFILTSYNLYGLQ